MALFLILKLQLYTYWELLYARQSVFDVPVSDFIYKAHLISTHMCFGYRWHVYFLFTCYFYSKHKHVKIIPTILTGLSLCILTDDKHPEVDFHYSSCFPGSVNPPPPHPRERYLNILGCIFFWLHVLIFSCH